MPVAGAGCSLRTAFLTDRMNELTRGILRLPNCLGTGLLLLRGAFNKFPDIFVLAVKIVVDS